MDLSLPPLRDQKWLVTGASGLLGEHLVLCLEKAGAHVDGVCNKNVAGYVGRHVNALDLSNEAVLRGFLQGRRYDFIIHAAGITNVDLCELEPALAEAIHVSATATLAQHAQKTMASFCYISTDHLWNDPGPFLREDTPVSPLNQYASTKYKGETAALGNAPKCLVARTNFIGFGNGEHRSFLNWLVTAIRSGEAFNGFKDVWFTPIAVSLLSQHLIYSLCDGLSGVFNIAGQTRVSKFEFARKVAEEMGCSRSPIQPTSVDSFIFAAKRPKDMSLSVEKYQLTTGRKLPCLDETLSSLFPQVDRNPYIERQ